jgi:hypothetical protein
MFDDNLTRNFPVTIFSFSLLYRRERNVLKADAVKKNGDAAATLFK